MEPLQEDKTKKTITHLLLNTPGACFLCLQDNDGGADPVEVLNGGIIDLTNICRYLNINQCSLLLTSLNNDGGSSVEGLQNQLCSFSVNLCPKCLELTKKLNDMIIKLEEAKLMVNFHLSSFHKVLEGEENWEESLEWINLLGRMNALKDNSMDAKLVERLREEAKDKCIKILKKAEVAMPQVILTKRQDNPQKKVKTIKRKTPKKSKSPSKCTRPPSGEVPNSVEQLIKKLQKTSLIISTPSKLDKDSTAKKTKGIKKCRCPFCGETMAPLRFARHLANLHPDKLLAPFANTAALDKPNEFSEICGKVLASQLAKVTKIPSTPTASSSSARVWPKLCCHLCAKIYSDGRNLKYHFLVDHTDNLCEVLIKMHNVTMGIQDKQEKKKVVNKVEPLKDKPLKAEDKLLEAKPMKKILRRSAEEKTCTICKLTFFQVGKLRRHQATKHLDQLFLECKPSWMGGVQYSGNVKEIFKREVEGATYGKIYKCGYCPPGGEKSYKGHQDFMVHLVFEHREEMEGKLRQDGVEEGMEVDGDDNFCLGGDEEEDRVVMEGEEGDGGDFDVKPDVGELEKMLCPDMVSDELGSKEEEEDGDLDYLQQQYGHFEEDADNIDEEDVDDGLMY